MLDSFLSFKWCSAARNRLKCHYTGRKRLLRVLLSSLFAAWCWAVCIFLHRREGTGLGLLSSRMGFRKRLFEEGFSKKRFRRRVFEEGLGHCYPSCEVERAIFEFALRVISFDIYIRLQSLWCADDKGGMHWVECRLNGTGCGRPRPSGCDRFIGSDTTINTANMPYYPSKARQDTYYTLTH